MNPKNLWISEGDVTGISYEILEKVKKEILGFANTSLVFLIQTQNKFQLDFAHTLQQKDLKEISHLKSGFYQVCFANSKTKFSSLKLGRPSPLSGQCSYESFLKAVEHQKIYGGNILTLPLSKEFVIKSGNKKFQGHTEELEKLYKTKTIMLMYSHELSVIPLTTHIPLKQVPTKAKKVDLEFVLKTLTHTKIFPKPQIGICGLNPHCGEGGKIALEEKDWMEKKIKELKKNYPIHDMISADSIFTKEIRKKFQVILAWYHDQGLIPFKAIAGKQGINVTLGLSFFRVSPDHGPAFDIAGKGIASSESLKTCLDFLRLINN